MARIDVNTTLQQVLEEHKQWLDNKGGSRANLSGAKLAGANLAEANLAGADLSGTNLDRANLSGANLDRANLSGAHLYRADLSGANLSGANLSGAHLYRADLSGANLAGASLFRADLARTDLTGTIYEKDIPIIINTEYYRIVKTKKFIEIGCQQHTPKEWNNFTDEEIDRMGGKTALRFWKKYKTFVLSNIK